MSLISNGEYDVPVRFAVHQYRTNGAHPMYGYFDATIRDIENK